MKRSLASLGLFVVCLLGSALVQTGCGDPLVGLECAKGNIICNGRCVDLDSDEFNCGACGTVCAIDEMCIASECTTDFDSGRPGPNTDSGLDGGGGDGGIDGGRDAGDANTEGWPDADLPPLCTEDPRADCVCDLGQLMCENTCVDANIDTFNCGACGNNCNISPPPMGSYFCVDGQCRLNCDPPYSVCGNTCVDLQTDWTNCGNCGFVCVSGLCDMGQCLDRTAGHVILLGHDMQSALPAARRLAGNALFLPSKANIRMLVYEGQSLPSQRAGVTAAIREMHNVTGRMYTRVDESDPAQVPLQLSQMDVFAVVTQENATDSDLLEIGDMWSRALRTFVARGGVVVVFDAGMRNSGTYQILQQAGLITVTQRMPLTPRVVHVEAPGDALASFVPAMYQAQMQTAGFDTADTTVVVRDRTSGLPVIIHIAR